MSKVLFERTYGDEDFWMDIQDHICDLAEMQEYKELPEYQYDFKSGTFKVTITWEADE